MWNKIIRLQIMRRKLIERALKNDSGRKHYWLEWINSTIKRLYDQGNNDL